MSPISRRGLLTSSTAALLAAGTNTLFVPAARAVAGTTGDGGSAFAFTHPGLLHSAADVARMKSAVDGRPSPVYDGYLALAAHSRSQTAYTIQNAGQITQPPIGTHCGLSRATAPTPTRLATSSMPGRLPSR